MKSPENLAEPRRSINQALPRRVPVPPLLRPLQRNAATSGHQHIVIKSPDTDVFILTIFSQLTLPETSFFNTGTGDWRFSGDSVDVISSAISPELSCALPGLHAFTGKTALTRFVLT